MTERTIKVAVSGLGIAGTRKVETLARSSKTDLIAACDVRPQALRVFEQKYGGRTYERYEDLCADPDVEAIWISTPNHLHAHHVVTAAQHGKHTIVEKPIAISMEEAAAMVEASEKYGTKLLAGHSSGIATPMRQLIETGAVGRLCAINAWSYTEWMLRPRMPQEVDLSMGGGLVYRQGPHQVNTIRVLGGGLVRSVRASVGSWMTERPCPGYYSAFLEFEDGTPATFVHNGYGYFSATELASWAEGRSRPPMEDRVRFRKELRAGTLDEAEAKEAWRFGGEASESASWVKDIHEVERDPGGWTPGDPGLFVLSCERGDIRQGPKGLLVYDDEGTREVPISSGGEHSEIDEMYQAITQNRPVYRDGRWGMATLEVCLAIMQSAKERREIQLTHQVPLREPDL